MNADERAIRDVVSRWHSATAAGNIAAVLSLMAEDVVFLVAGQAPMKGRSAFERGLRDLLASCRIDSSSNIQEIEVSGKLAYCWNVLHVEITPLAGGDKVVRSGNVLSIFRKQDDDAWVVWRDANLLTLAK
ncbi:MAG TPA: SgcJ/EcaC family oxidoreductase [Azonexus sp.]|nr:SgcJ/EcaC family oxidoreductase [Azonexus sp.]